MSQTMSGALRMGIAQLAGAGCSSPALDARLLLGEASGLSTTAILTGPDLVLGADAQRAYERMLQRRCGGEPVARILGRREFWSLSFRLTPETLVPRPETETLVEAVLARIGHAAGPRPRMILDLGTGSGAILLALLAELPDAFGVGLDRSFGAVAAARANAAHLRLDGRAAFLCGDFTQTFSDSFDVVVSNPPYVAKDDLATLPVEVGRFDPGLALDGGDDGLDAYRVLAATLPRLLAGTGFAAIEIGAGQESDVSELFRSSGLQPQRPARADLAGIPRALIVGNAAGSAKKPLETGA